MRHFVLNREHIAVQILLRLWPFPRGSGRLIDRLFSHVKFKQDIETVITTDGFRLIVEPNELIGRHLYLTGEFDRSTFEILQKFSKTGDTLLDVGANVGYVSACFLKNVQKSKIIAVEPQPAVASLLHENLKQFGSDRFCVYPVAISNVDGEANLEICEYNKGASKIVAQADTNTVKVKMRSASSFINELNEDKIDLIKIDVEGHEEQVISDLLPAIKALRPRAVVYEDHADKSAPENPIGAMFADAGYRVFGIKKRLTTLKLIPIRTRTECAMNDYIAVRD